MTEVELLLKIKQLEKDKAALQFEVKQLKKQVKSLQSVEAIILKECDNLSKELAKYKPFTDYDEILHKM